MQTDIASFPFACREGPEDSILIDVQYLGEKATFTPEQLAAMLIVDLKSIAEARSGSLAPYCTQANHSELIVLQNDGSPVSDCVISVPVYFTEAERNAMLAAARIANVNCLRLLHETTAVALAYGIYRTDLPEAAPSIVAFVDIGASSMQARVRLELLSKQLGPACRQEDSTTGPSGAEYSTAGRLNASAACESAALHDLHS